jgi:hypothetical protein
MHWLLLGALLTMLVAAVVVKFAPTIRPVTVVIPTKFGAVIF